MLLKPYRVLDVTGPLGYLAGRILGDLGADVIKIEPRAGDPWRGAPPHLTAEDGVSHSLTWSVLNANKRGITLDLESRTGGRLFRRLAGKADFVLESFPPGTLDRWGLDYKRLSLSNRGLIMVSITPFGQNGPYREFVASDLEIMALSGAMSLAGEPEGEPMRVTVPQAPLWAGVEAAMGALTALACRSVTGHGQHVDVSAQVAVMAALAHAPTFWDMNRINPQRAGIYITGRSVSGAKIRAIWPCKDGWINFIIYGGAAGRHTNQQLVSWMDETGLAPEWLKRVDWSTFEVPGLTQAEVDRLEAPIGEFLATLTKQQFFDGALERGMLGYPVSTVDDIDKDPHLAARRFWQMVTAPGSGRSLKYPGGFALINGKRLLIERPAPRVGEHNDEVIGKELSPLALASFKQPE